MRFSLCSATTGNESETDVIVSRIGITTTSGVSGVIGLARTSSRLGLEHGVEVGDDTLRFGGSGGFAIGQRTISSAQVEQRE